MDRPAADYIACTRSGRTVRVVQDRKSAPHGWWVVIDGEPAQHLAPPLVYRDGGTKIFQTDRGRVTTPRTAWGETEGSLDGEALSPCTRDETQPCGSC